MTCPPIRTYAVVLSCPGTVGHLHDNTKVVVLGRDAGGVPHRHATFLDFALRAGFEKREVPEVDLRLLARLRPGQWAGLPDARRAAEPLGRQRAALDVETRPLAVYDALVGVTR